MKNNKAGWRRNDLATMLEGFGFIIRNGKNHDIAIHPDYPSFEYRITMPKENKELLKAYISKAVRVVNIIGQLEKGEGHE